MTMPKKNRRQIQVDGELYYWNDRKVCGTDTIAIQRATGGSCIKAIPLAIMTPKHVEACIRFAIDSGWSPADRQNLWLAFYLDHREPDVSRFQRVAQNAEFRLRIVDGWKTWFLPLESGQEWRPGELRDAPANEANDVR